VIVKIEILQELRDVEVDGKLVMYLHWHRSFHIYMNFNDFRILVLSWAIIAYQKNVDVLCVY